jgi:hypothetical protein
MSKHIPKPKNDAARIEKSSKRKIKQNVNSTLSIS